jgi:hypothetical protein
MAKLLFKLNNVPDDEAQEIRELLEVAEIDFYETSAGNFGLSFAAIWLNNEPQFVHAKALIQQYQNERYKKMTEHKASLKLSGQNLSYWQLVQQSPIKFPAALIFIAIITYFSILPFFPA